MNENNCPTIVADVLLVASEGRASFGYEAGDELSKRHLQSNGDIDCASPDDLGSGPANIQFQLRTPKITLDGTDYELQFVGRESVHLSERGSGKSSLSGWIGCLLRVLRLQPAQFHGFTNPEGNPHKLRMTNRNNDGKRYKYTLRVRAHAAGGGGVRWLEHDPMIKNRGGGTSSY